MPYILALIIILYSIFFLSFKKYPGFLHYRKWLDIAASVAVLLLLLFWSENFDYTFLLILYFFVSAGFIAFLYLKLKKTEVKKEKAQQTIKVLKDEEKLLEDEVQRLENAKNQSDEK
jgi:predicted membrane protein